ncbi:MAG TPA: T9SS type A sorting domain-containing protein [Saprospiraceae bacterium]|nr:T9SS type A sorting domain-containing protein [Saprospiraceae bacterium]HPN69657.1 T9SS type A sorting domain-containing protein [Saprospiraceae bacterium]
MKILLLLQLLITSCLLSAQCIQYTYDNAGNRTARNTTCTALMEEMVYDRSIDEKAIEAKIQVAPNPSENQINILQEGFTEAADVLIYNVSGFLVERRKLMIGVLEIENLIPGMYILTVSEGIQKQTTTFLKQ